jgi:hypothetical protein
MCYRVKDTEVNKGHKNDILADLPWWPLFSFVSFLHDMDFPLPIVPLWKILSVVTAAAFFAPQRRPGDQASDGQQVVMAPLVWRRRSRRGARSFQGVNRFRETLSSAKQADRSPHQIADFSRG